MLGRTETAATRRRVAARTGAHVAASVRAPALWRAVTRAPVVAGAYVAAIVGIFVLAYAGRTGRS